MEDRTTSFSFRKDDYRNIVLGSFGFSGMPVIHPELHQGGIDLLATSEHEQHHDLLARQTTHGYVIAFGVRFLQSGGLDEASQSEVSALLERLVDEGREIHEAFAVFNTLRTNPMFYPLVERLTPEYLVYLERAEAAIPSDIAAMRLARSFLYAAVLAALSPSLSPPHDPDPMVCYQSAAHRVMGSDRRWSRILDALTGHSEEFRTSFFRLVDGLGFSTEERWITLGEDDMEPFGEAFHQRERDLVEGFARFLGERLFGAPKTTSAKSNNFCHFSLLSPCFTRDCSIFSTKTPYGNHWLIRVKFTYQTTNF